MLRPDQLRFGGEIIGQSVCQLDTRKPDRVRPQHFDQPAIQDCHRNDCIRDLHTDAQLRGDLTRCLADNMVIPDHEFLAGLDLIHVRLILENNIGIIISDQNDRIDVAVL